MLRYSDALPGILTHDGGFVRYVTLNRKAWMATAAFALLITPRRSIRAQDSVAAQGRYAAVAQTLTRFIEHERAQKAIPAISIALVDRNEIVWARGFGWADTAAGTAATAMTEYRVGSVSKLFTDLAIMKLVEQKKLDLDAPVTRYLPTFRPKNPFGGEITIRQLTSHRSGLTREPPVGNYFDDAGPSLAATVASLNGTTLVYKPGSHTKYSNAGIAVLGYVLERTQAESFYPYLKKAVLDPMGSTSTLPSAVSLGKPVRSSASRAGAACTAVRYWAKSASSPAGGVIVPISAARMARTASSAMRECVL